MWTWSASTLQLHLPYNLLSRRSLRPRGASDGGIMQLILLLEMSQRLMILCVNYLHLILSFYELLVSHPSSLLLLLAGCVLTLNVDSFLVQSQC